MKHSDARAVVEEMRRDTRLWLPPLSDKRGFSSTRVEHLLNKLVAAMPEDETYLEVGSLEGRTLEAAAHGNPTKRIVACDPGSKYGSEPEGIPANVTFFKNMWQESLPLLNGIGLAFYDGDHSERETRAFLLDVVDRSASEAVIVLDDWDRESVRAAAHWVLDRSDKWSLVNELPEYTDGLTCPPNRFGYYFGIGILGWRA